MTGLSGNQVETNVFVQSSGFNHRGWQLEDDMEKLKDVDWVISRR